MPNAPFGAPTNWLTVLTVDEPAFGASPTLIREHLESLDIEARPAWKPMHLQPLYAGHPVRGGRVSEQIFATGLCVPSGSSMTDADVDRVVGRRGRVRGCYVVAPAYAAAVDELAYRVLEAPCRRRPSARTTASRRSAGWVTVRADEGR